jgi:tungstate transport system substrate-binding protein
MRIKNLLPLLVAACLLFSACAPAAAETPTAPANPNLILATTTSTQDSGLLDVLVPLSSSRFPPGP